MTPQELADDIATTYSTGDTPPNDYDKYDVTGVLYALGGDLAIKVRRLAYDVFAVDFTAELGSDPVNVAPMLMSFEDLGEMFRYIVENHL